jgi:hypothetical protein
MFKLYPLLSKLKSQAPRMFRNVGNQSITPILSLSLSLTHTHTYTFVHLHACKYVCINLFGTQTFDLHKNTFS